MSRKNEIEEVAFEDVVHANNGPRMPKKIRAKEVWTHDPGTQRAGSSIFTMGKLRHTTVSVGRGTDIGLRVQQIGKDTGHFFKKAGKATAPQNTVVVVERPKVYLTGPMAKKVNPRDLMWTASTIGAFLTAMPLGVEEVVEYEPLDWKGSKDKIACNLQVLEALYPEEIALLPCKGRLVEKTDKQGRSYIEPEDDDNLIDSIGIGLYYLQRML